MATTRPDPPEATAPGPASRRPARLLAAALALGLATIAGFGYYIVREIHRLGDEQATIADRNRKDSLQLLRLQNDLASLVTLEREMVTGTEPYPIQAWRPAFDRVRADIDEALALERTLAPEVREPSQQARVEKVVAAYWETMDRVFAVAAQGDEAKAIELVRTAATQQHMELSAIVSQFLVANNQLQEQAVAANRAIFDRVAREIGILVAVLLVVLVAVGVPTLLANDRAFTDVARMTAQLRALSWRTLRVQEDLQRTISRELHDDFGQIVTAIGTMLGRARRHVTSHEHLEAELDAARRVAQEALERIRARSQWLHPGVLDDFGLETALARAVEQFERRTGIRARFSAAGPVGEIRQEHEIHVYRIVQEALGNVDRHSGSPDAEVRLRCGPEGLVLQVEDHGRGLPDGHGTAASDGIGLVSMRERAELMGGHLTLHRPASGGLVVEVRVAAWRRTDIRDEVAV